MARRAVFRADKPRERRQRGRSRPHGGRGGVALNNEILACTGTSALNTAGELTIRHTAALISRCSLFVSNDSGLAHIAAAVRTPLIVLFGKTDVDRIAPRGENVNIPLIRTCSGNPG